MPKQTNKIQLNSVFKKALLPIPQISNGAKAKGSQWSEARYARTSAMFLPPTQILSSLPRPPYVTSHLGWPAEHSNGDEQLSSQTRMPVEAQTLTAVWLFANHSKQARIFTK